MFVLATKLVLIKIILTYFAMILPGKAKLRVCFLPFVGLKIADGLEVSTASVDSLFASPEFSLRFCEPSVSCTRLAFTYVPTLTWFSGAIFVQSYVSCNSLSNGGNSRESLSGLRMKRKRNA